jgi:hypothetical protein
MILEFSINAIAHDGNQIYPVNESMLMISIIQIPKSASTVIHIVIGTHCGTVFQHYPQLSGVPPSIWHLETCRSKPIITKKLILGYPA